MPRGKSRNVPSPEQLRKFIREKTGRLSKQERKELERKKASARAEAKRKTEIERIKKFKPKASERGRLVFISGKTGQRLRKTERVKGYLLFISKTGKKTLLKPATKTKVASASLRDFEPELKQQTKKAAEKFYAKRKQLAVLRETKHKGQFGYKNLETVSLQNLQKFGQRYRGNKKILFEVSFRAGNRKVNVMLGLSAGEMVRLKRGDSAFLKDYLWKQISTELALEDTVTVGSANYISKLKRNKGKKPSQWRTKSGELWGKHKYRKVRLSDIETKIYTLKK